MNFFTNPLTDYSPQMEMAGFSEAEFGAGGTSVLSEAEEMELASEFLEISNEQELEQFIGSLGKKVSKALGKIAKSPIMKTVGGVLKGVVKTALPIAGGALGTFVGGPVGTVIGSQLGSMAGQVMGLELEGLSEEDREFEASRQFVRFAAETVKNALEAPPGLDPQAAAHGSAVEAARKYAPGLMNIAAANGGPTNGRTGRWIRRHGNIVLFGV